MPHHHSHSHSPPRTRGAFSPSSNPTYSYSYRRRRAAPRPGFISNIIDIIRRIIRDAIKYFKQNPARVLVPLLMALVSGGGLAALARKFGVRLPGALGSALGAGGGLGRGMGAGYDAWGRFEEGAGAGGGMGMARSLLKVASGFL